MFTSAAIRPVPPHQDETMSENGFRLYDMVNVFANYGWWFGFISGKIELYRDAFMFCSNKLNA
uniref:Uncharacterized protein n=1 Tax=Solanum lycopersicum TaxID=4081 RepID=A0A3Q7GZ96_SOLLC